MKKLLTLAFFLTGLGLHAQEKLEVERGVRQAEVPEEARMWLQANAPDVRVQWFAEETSGKKSYEAKFKRLGDWYSVEFDQKGALEDVEVIMDWKQLDPAVRQVLSEYFDSSYAKYKLRKIQRQYSGEASAVVAAFADPKAKAPGLIVRYEIEYFGKSDGDKALWEGLFDAAGTFIEKRPVVLRPTDNLNY